MLLISKKKESIIYEKEEERGVSLYTKYIYKMMAYSPTMPNTHSAPT